MDIPVKSTFFPHMRLSPRETSAYYAKATRAMDQVREAATTFSWKRVENKDGLVVGKVHIVEQHASAASNRVGKNTACLVMRGTTTVRATVAEVVQLLGATDTADARKSLRRLHGRNFVDTMTLARVDCGDDNLASCRIKWAAFKESDTNVDYCFLEYAGIEVDARGSPLGFCILTSIDRPKEVPSLAALGFRRDEFHRTGFLVYPSLENPEAVHVTAIAQSTSSDKTSSSSSLDRLEATVHHRINRVLLSLPDFVTMRRLGALPAVDRTQWIQDSCRKFCAVCLKSFHFVRKHHCRMCGEVVCGTCATPREVDIPSLGSSAQVRVCSVCVERAHAVAGQQAAVAALAAVQLFPRRRPNHPLPPSSSSVSSPQVVQDDSINNQLALDEFDVVDRNVLANHCNHHHHQDDVDSRTTLGTVDGYDDCDYSRHDAVSGTPQRATSTHSPRQQSTMNRVLFDSSEFTQHLRPHQRPHSAAPQSSPNREKSLQPSKLSAVVANAQLKNVHELSMRLTRIREMLNQSMPTQTTAQPPPPPPDHSTAWVILSPASMQRQLAHGRQDRAFELLDEDDDDEDHTVAQSETRPGSPPLLGNKLDVAHTADDNHSSNFEEDYLDDLSYSLQEDESASSNPPMERQSMSGFDSNDEGIDIHGDFQDDDDDLFYSHTMIAGSTNSPTRQDNDPDDAEAMPESGGDADTKAGKGEATSEVDQLLSQVSELRRLLANANQRLHAVEASVTQSPQVQATTKIDKTIRVVELQTGNAATDPCVVQRRHAHRAVVLELHAIMGLE